MFDLSLAEMGVIVVTAALVIGPKDLPIVLRKVGKAWARLKHLGADLRRQFDESPLGAELRAAEAEVARETHDLRRTHTILGTDGQPYEAYTLDDFVDASRAPQGPTPISVNSSPLEGGTERRDREGEGGGAAGSEADKGTPDVSINHSEQGAFTPTPALPPQGGGSRTPSHDSQAMAGKPSQP